MVRKILPALSPTSRSRPYHIPQQQGQPPIKLEPHLPRVKVEEEHPVPPQPRLIAPKPGRFTTQCILLPEARDDVKEAHIIEEVTVNNGCIEVIENFFKDQIKLINRGENVVALSQVNLTSKSS